MIKHFSKKVALDHTTNINTDKSKGFPKSIGIILWFSAIALIYYIIGRLSSNLIFEPEGIIAIWPASGIFLSAILLTKRKLRPVLVVVLFLTDLLVESKAGFSMNLSLVFAFSVTLDASLSAWILRRILGEFKYFSKTKDFTVFIVFSVILSNAVASTTAAFGSFFLQGAGYWQSWHLWWSSDAVGNLLITPFILRWFDAFKNKIEFANFRRNMELVFISVIIVIISYLSIYLLHDRLEFFLLLNFLSFPFLIWSVVRFEIKGATLTSVILTTVIIFFEINSSFKSTVSQLDLIINIQLFFAIAAISAYYLATVITERNHAMLNVEKREQQLKQKNDEYESINEELRQTNEELHEAKASIEENEKLLVDIMNGSSSFIFLFDTEGRYIHVNEQMARYFGKRPDEIIGKTREGLMPQEIIEQHLRNDRRVIETGEILLFEEETIEKDGKHYYYSTKYPLRDRDNNIYGVAGFSTDITEKKLIELELIKAKEKAEEGEEKYRTLVENSFEGIGWARGNKLLFANKELMKILGYDSVDEILKVPLLDLVAPESRKSIVEKIKNREQKKGIADHYEYKMIRKDGQIREAEISSQEIFINNEYIVQSNIRDITDRKQFENELIKAKEKAEESDRLKTAFIQNMSHEIRTPLNAIMGFSGILLRNADNGEKLKYYTDIIKTRSNDLLDIINDILDISKIEAGSLQINNEVCKLDELFSELNIMFTEQKIRTHLEPVSLLFEIENHLQKTAINTDKGKLKQILTNLIGNALKFTIAGSIKCSCKLENNKILFMVSDTGIGIPADKLDYIFQRFAQLNALPSKNLGGTGLGLPIVKGLVDLLGGNIRVDSELSKGSVFSFTIDCEIVEQESISNKAKPESLMITGKQKTILIVEDDFYNSEYLKEVLSDYNFKLICAYTAKDAIKLATEQSIDLILMDIRLPDLNGYEASMAILKSKPKMKIIAQTAYATAEEKYQALKMGFLDYMSIGNQ